MSQYTFGFNLKSQGFPLLQEQQLNTTIVASTGEAKSASSSPSVAYAHNVLPTEYGLASVAFKELLAPISFDVEGESLIDVRIIYSEQKSRVYAGFTSLGNLYVLPPKKSKWSKVTIERLTSLPLFSSFSPDSITIANVKGQSYIFYKKAACFIFTEVGLVLQEVELVGLDLTKIIGVVGSYGYMVAYSDTEVVWSSVLLATDFVPDGVNGAGSAAVSNISGSILYCTPSNYGFVIYTYANAVAGSFTGNARYPFKFAEIADSNGAISLDYLAYEANGAIQIALTKSGLQTVSAQEAKAYMPELTDFLFGRKFDTFNEVTLKFESYTVPSGTLKKKLKLIAGRYIVISYGIPTQAEFSHALVLDLALDRLGKLKINHSDVFEFLFTQTEIARESLALTRADGSTVFVDMSNLEYGVGVILLGKFQYSDSRLVQVLSVEIEHTPEADPTKLYNFSYIDGRELPTIQANVSELGDYTKKFSMRSTAKIHSFLLLGAFKLTSAVVTYTVAGRR